MRPIYAVLLCCTAVSAEAQTPDSAPRGWASGLSIGVPGEAGRRPYPALLTVGATFSQITPGAGADISIFTVPRILPEGALPLLARVGVGHAIPLDSAKTMYFMPSVGVLAAGIVTENGGGATGGWSAGGAVIAFGSSGALRAACNLYGFGDVAAWHFEVGFVSRPGLRK